MAYLRKSVAPGHGRFDVRREAFINFNHQRAVTTNQVVVVAIVTLRQKFKPSYAISEVKSPDKTHFLQRMKIAVNGRQIATFPPQGSVDFLVAQRVLMPPEHIQYRLARAGNFARTLPQAFGQFRQRLLDKPVRMRVLATRLFH
jgi:hypothetical protein